MNSDPALTALIAAVRRGDAGAREELFRTARVRLETLARRMLRRHPAIRWFADTGDVFQNSTVRLLRALESTPVNDTREFFNLAASIIRRELIDLARHYLGPNGVGTRETTPGDLPESTSVADAADLDRWTALHEAVGKLPPPEREVFGLTLYHGWTQPQIAEFLAVDVRTVRRRWRAAVETLHASLGGAFPEV